MQASSSSAIYPVILSGGSGTRLWPLSRAMYPKQFIRFNGEDASFLSETLHRLSLSPDPPMTFRCRCRGVEPGVRVSGQG